MASAIAQVRQHPILAGSFLLAAMIGVGGTTLALQSHKPAAPVQIQVVLPPPVAIGANWRPVHEFKTEEARPAGGMTPDRMAEIRAQLYLPSLPAPVKKNLPVRRAQANAAPRPVTTAAAAAAPAAETLISNRTNETLQTMEAFKAAMKAIGGPDLTANTYKEN